MRTTCLLLTALALGCGDDDLAIDAATPDAASDGGSDGGVDAGAVDAGSYEPSSEPGRHTVTIESSRAVVPSAGLPAETVPDVSNNNVDVVRHDGRVYLAWRTGPYHFASADVVMHVVSSEDEITWTHETTIDLDTDVREPRFLSLDGKLFLYFAVLGTNRYAFEPMGIRRIERVGGTWGEHEAVDGMTGYVVWRTKVERGTAYMTSYLGGEHIYLFDGEPLFVELRTTTDGLTWTPLSPSSAPAQSWIYTGGGSETDFAIADDGSLFGVIRNEAGDESGWGSLVCRAPAGDLAAWSCRHDPRKYDSPLMFWHDGEAYLIARRNVSPTGHYDLGMPRGGADSTTILYQLDYVDRPKRCALWRYVQDEDRMAWILDLPSKGDTCFPARIAGEREDEVIVYDYSSDPEGPDLAWHDGQEGPTQLYRHVLRFTPR
ncbi:MAG: hypothetical protein R3B99_06365 [Polyangiales bacterium]